MREEYLKYVLAFKNMNTESKKSELVSQLAELIKFINDTNKQIDIPDAYLPVLTNAVEEDDYLTQLFTLIISLKEENGKLVNYLIDNNII